jgi:hypothetical protein
VPLAVFAMMLPISINAIGLREGAFVFLLGMYGVEPSVSIGLAWIAYGLLVLQGLIGGILYAIRK